MRRSTAGDTMGLAARLGLAALALLIVAAGGLAYYAGTLTAPHRTYQQVLPNDQFPN